MAVDEAVIADLHAAAHAEVELIEMENAYASHVETIYYSAACASTATLTVALTIAAVVWTQDGHGASETVAMLASRHDDFDSQDDGAANLLWTLWAGVLLVPMTYFVFTLLLLLRVVLHDGVHGHHTEKQSIAAATAG